MLSRLSDRARNGIASMKPVALQPLSANARPSNATASEAPLPPTPPPFTTTPMAPLAGAPRRPKTRLHKALGYAAPVCRNFTLAIPLAVIAMLAYVHIHANEILWRRLNETKGGVTSLTWAPLWTTIVYFLIYIPWWYVVWANNYLSRRKNRPFLSRWAHIGGDIGSIVVTIVAVILSAILSTRQSELLVVGFDYAVAMAALYGVQIFFLVGTLVGDLYECWAEERYFGERINHV